MTNLEPHIQLRDLRFENRVTPGVRLGEGMVELRKAFDWVGEITTALTPPLERLAQQLRIARHHQVRFERHWRHGEGWMIFADELERRTRERLGMELW